MRVYVKEEGGQVSLINAVSGEEVGRFTDISEAVKYSLDNGYQLPLRVG
ncbi:MAG: hypothetical protein Q9M89_04830 [Persephonella sp.]|nr:hypothetical protein [Persephonella sp.]